MSNEDLVKRATYEADNHYYLVSSRDAFVAGAKFAADALSCPPVEGELVERVAELIEPTAPANARRRAAAIIPLVLEEAAKALSQRAQVYRTANNLERADGLDEGIAIIRNLGRPA